MLHSALPSAAMSVQRVLISIESICRRGVRGFKQYAGRLSKSFYGEHYLEPLRETYIPHGSHLKNVFPVQKNRLSLARMLQRPFFHKQCLLPWDLVHQNRT